MSQDNLPEPSFVDRDLAKITADQIALFEAASGKTLQPAQVERLLINLIAYRESLLRIAMQEAAKQNLAAYATYPMLDYLGQLVGVTRLNPQPARTTIQFTLAGVQPISVLISSGFRVRTKDGKFTFATETDLVIPAGNLTGDVTAACETAGVGGNGYLAGEIDQIVTPFGYVSTASNTTTSSDGADQEDDDAFRVRIFDAPNGFSSAGPVGAYKKFAKDAHQDVLDVAVVRPNPCYITIYVLAKTDPPSAELLSLVDTALSDDKVRPLGDEVTVTAATRVDYAIAADLTIYSSADAATVIAEGTAAVQAWCDVLAERLDAPAIVPSQIIGILDELNGVHRVVLNTPAYQALLDNEWANCTGIVLNVTGVV